MRMIPVLNTIGLISRLVGRVDGIAFHWGLGSLAVGRDA